MLIYSKRYQTSEKGTFFDFVHTISGFVSVPELCSQITSIKSFKFPRLNCLWTSQYYLPRIVDKSSDEMFNWDR